MCGMLQPRLRTRTRMERLMSKRINIGPLTIMGGLDKYELLTVSITREYLSLAILGMWLTVIW